jgi:hypothetical protein
LVFSIVFRLRLYRDRVERNGGGLDSVPLSIILSG